MAMRICSVPTYILCSLAPAMAAICSICLVLGVKSSGVRLVFSP